MVLGLVTGGFVAERQFCEVFDDVDGTGAVDKGEYRDIARPEFGVAIK